MSATEELRRMLDERGVEYETDDKNGLRETNWCGMTAFQLSPTAKMTMIVTPEQAIAATLGDDGVGRSKDGVSRWHELFGTPERAARVIVALNHCRVVCCEECAARGACRYDGCGDDYDALLEWLRGDA